jgi:FixJ family two-component response regulator
MAETTPLIYVVDDDESVLGSLKMLIESAGYRVVPFSSAENFLDSGFMEGPNCLVLDIRLPGISGFKLQERLIHLKIRIPVIFITGRGLFGMEDEAMRLGAIAYLRKPFDEQSLLDAIQRACEKRTEITQRNGAKT